MKLSEAMMLGSTLVKMEPANWNTCALGVAGTATGIPLCNLDSLNSQYERKDAIADKWPWLVDFCPERVPGPVLNTYLACDTQEQRIWVRFDTLVCAQHMTFEQLVDFVKSIEPECGECNRFECACAQSVDEKAELCDSVK